MDWLYALPGALLLAVIYEAQPRWGGLLLVLVVLGMFMVIVQRGTLPTLGGNT